MMNTPLARRDFLHLAAGASVLACGGAARSADAPAGALPQAKPEDIGIDPKRLQFA